MIHCLHREQIILASLAGVWEYFANPYNLNSITPPNMNFEIVSGGDVKMYEGQIIEYRVEFARGLRSFWLTEIENARENELWTNNGQARIAFGTMRIHFRRRRRA
ncbi:MAG: hypothetical protein ACYC6R_13830 [Anaerolineales bacterium]